MPDRAVLHLSIVVESIDAIRTYIGAAGKDEFLADPLRQDAVVLRLQVIGEAARHLSHADRALAPEIPWQHIVSLRNRIAHDYRSINFHVVWDIAQGELDDLQTSAKRLLAAKSA